MDQQTQDYAADIAAEAYALNVSRHQMASFIKAKFDGRYGPAWNVVIKKNFSSSVTHDTGHYTIFYLQQNTFQVYRCS